MVVMTADIETIRQMIDGCEGDGRKLSRFDAMQVLFAMQQLMREVDRMWNLYPEHATHNWRGKK